MSPSRYRDPRQQRTLDALYAALDRLLVRVAYPEITVTMITAEAGVGRPTFYRLFEDVNGLLIDRLRDDLDEQWRVAQDAAAAGMSDAALRTAAATFAFERIFARPLLYGALLGGAAGANAVTVFRDQVGRLFTLRPHADDEPWRSEARLGIGLFAGAISGFMLSWIEQGLTPPPAAAAALLERMLVPAR